MPGPYGSKLTQWFHAWVNSLNTDQATKDKLNAYGPVGIWIAGILVILVGGIAACAGLRGCGG